MLGPAARVLHQAAHTLHRLAGSACCDCTCGDCPANGHTCTAPIFGPRLRLLTEGVHTANGLALAGELDALGLANIGDQLDGITALVEDIRNLIDYQQEGPAE